MAFGTEQELGREQRLRGGLLCVHSMHVQNASPPLSILVSQEQEAKTRQNYWYIY